MHPLLGRVDGPGPDGPVDPSWFVVHGWAFGPVPVSRVEVWLDAHLLGRAGLGRPRPDVEEDLADTAALLSGFELVATLHPDRFRRGGRATLRTDVHLLDGRHYWLPDVTVPFRAAADGPAAGPHPVRPAGTADAGSATEPRPGARRGRAARVLWFTTSLTPGGTELRMVELIRRLQATGRTESTVITTDGGPLLGALEDEGVRVERFPPVPLVGVDDYEAAVEGLARRIDGSFDLVTGPTVTAFPAVDAANRIGVPTVLRIGESVPLRTALHWVAGPMDPAVEERARAAVAQASAVWSVSAAGVRAYRAGGYAGAFRVLSDGTDVVAPRRAATDPVRKGVRAELGIGPDDTVLLCIGTVCAVKGQSVLVQALAALGEEGGAVRCFCVGNADDTYAATVARFAARAGLAGRFTIVPFASDLDSWWCAADIAVSPSETEGMPGAVLEAMAHGLPVLASAVGDVPLAVEDGVTGWLVEPNDLGALRSGLRAALATPPDERWAMGRSAASTIASAWDADQRLDVMVTLMEDVVRGGTTPG